MIDWNPKLFQIGVPEIDAQHQSIFEKLNHFHEASGRGDDLREIQQLFDFLHDYTREHFSAEERLMAEHNYPEIDEQRREHRELITKLYEFREKMSADPDPRHFFLPIYNLLSGWLVNHISSLDKEIGVYLKGRTL
jgi:hemerythrin-like metal-binding protein